MKKLLTLVLTVLLALTATAALAETYQDMPTVTIRNVYEAANEGTTSPAETFEFTISAKSVTDAAAGITVQNMPTPTLVGITYEAGEAGGANKAKNLVVTLPQYSSVGVYTYALTPVAGNNAGVTYLKSDISLVVTVIEQDGKIRVAAVHTETAGNILGAGKSDLITHLYSAGKLDVTKQVKGNLGDRSRYFEVTLTLTGEDGKTYAETYSISGGSYEGNPTSVAIGVPTKMMIKDGETLSVLNLPYGVTYTVTEADYSADGYETEVTASDENRKIDSASDLVTVINTKEKGIDTGISIETLPYVLLLAVAVAGGLILALGRRDNK